MPSITRLNADSERLKERFGIRSRLGGFLQQNGGRFSRPDVWQDRLRASWLGHRRRRDLDFVCFTLQPAACTLRPRSSRRLPQKLRTNAVLDQVSSGDLQLEHRRDIGLLARNPAILQICQQPRQDSIEVGRRAWVSGGRLEIIHLGKPDRVSVKAPLSIDLDQALLNIELLEQIVVRVPGVIASRLVRRVLQALAFALLIRSITALASAMVVTWFSTAHRRHGHLD